MDKFHVSVQSSQMYLFIFLFAVAAGTLIGGPIGDRFGRKYVIWFSILGVALYTIAASCKSFLDERAVCFIGVILCFCFFRDTCLCTGIIAGKDRHDLGLFFGFAFGMGGSGSALLGTLADHTSIEYVYNVCAFLPLIGLLTAFLPNIGGRKKTCSLIPDYSKDNCIICLVIHQPV